MALASGTRIGAYEVVALLGRGGMGEVYRARDAKLSRDVALKVLSASLTHDESRVARLRREAQVLASLNHPHIGGIYGLEDADGVTALVLELVEGPTLADRIATGPMPLDEALPIARQIADALATAHEQGIVHRDLKPANIKVRPDGTVKVLDFGLAKATDAASSSADLAQAPTMTVAADQSVEGVIRGTPAYMSPEQAAGFTVDRRTDIWAFGVVLFEMLSGEPVFAGESSAHVLAAVVRAEIDWTTLPAETPPSIRRLLRRCLEKDRKKRLDSSAVARLELDESGASTEAVMMPAALARRPVVPIAIAAAIGGAVLAAIVLWSTTRPTPVPSQASTHFTITPPAALFLRPSLQAVARDFAVAPDGSFFVYRAGPQGQLAVRFFDRLEIAILGGVTGASMPFVSPDSKWVGFVEDSLTLKKIAVDGGAPVTLTQLPVWPRGASWVDDATIIIGTNSATTGLLRVPAGGGNPEVLTKPDREHGEEGHVLPFGLPGGRAVLFTIGAAEPADAQIAVFDLASGKYTTVLRGGRDAQFVSSGHMIYLSGLALSAVRFDPDSRTVIGNAERVMDGVSAAPTGALNVAVTAAGTMVSVPDAHGPAAQRVLAWVDRQGHETAIAAPPRPYESARLSPDATRVAVSIRDEQNDIWTWNLARQILTRLTFDPDVDLSPVWTPDSRRILFASARTGALNLYARDVDTTTPEVRLTSSANTELPDSVTPDGAFVISHQVRPKTKSDLTRVALGPGSGISSPEDLVTTPFDDWNGEVSPDGRFIVYQSSESGEGSIELFVRPYPQSGTARWQVSSGGGDAPVWARDGRELIYLDAENHLTSVSVDTTGSTFRAGPPITLVKSVYYAPGPWRAYDVSPDGQRFLVLKEQPAASATAPTGFVVVQHWFEELKRLVPSK